MDYIYTQTSAYEAAIAGLCIYKKPKLTLLIAGLLCGNHYYQQSYRRNSTTKLGPEKKTMKAFLYDVNKKFSMNKNANIPKISSNEALVEVRAASLNPVDYKLIPHKIPFYRWFHIPTVGRDFSGVIIDIGSNVKAFKIGDHVYGNAAGGSLQEFTRVRENDIALKPKNLSFLEAASIGLAGSTSLQALKYFGDLNRKKVLIIGGSGGCGSLGVQIAKYYNAKVYVVCGSKNVEYVKSLGADVVLDYTAHDYLKQIENEKFDLIYDTVSSKDDSDQEAIYSKYLKGNDHGKYVAINGKFGDITRCVLHRLFQINIERRNFHITLLNWNSQDLEILRKMAEEGKLKPKIHIFNPTEDDVYAAFNLLQSRRTVGKIVFDIKF